MRFFTPLVTIALATAAAAVALPQTSNGKPAAFFLSGDSTVAPGGGWGDGFLALLTGGASGKNYGHKGTTTVSFQKIGDWKKVLDNVKAVVKTNQPYVYIQFGHNDQFKISIQEFETNLNSMVANVRSAGGIPILVTSLSRRAFKNGRVDENLAQQAAITLKVAKYNNAAVIDLNKASTAYINAIGSSNADRYNLKKGDDTHLNRSGGIVFGNMVAKLTLANSALRVSAFLKPNKAVSDALDAKKFILP